MNRLIVPAILLGLLGLLAYGLFTPQKDPPNVLLDKPAPQFVLKDDTGKTQDLSAYKGKPVLINFWASWCDPCRQESPLFARMSNELAGKVPFLGILYNDEAKNAKRFSAEYGLTYPTLLDPGSRTAMRYGIGQVPVTYILDSSGKIVYHKLGPFTEEKELRDALKKAGADL